MPITHAFVNPKADGGDATVARPSDWNAAHTGVLALANGGTNAVLVDPNADRILFWDDSAGAFTFLTLGTALTITGTTINAAVLESGTWSDVVGSRALATTYRNTSGKKRRVTAYLTGGDTARAGIECKVGPADPPTIIMAVQSNQIAAGAGLKHVVGAYFEVPNNHYYRVAAVVGTETLTGWAELDE